MKAVLTIAARPEVFVVGDLALPKQNAPLPMVAQVAMQGGEYVGKSILNRIKGLPVAPFKYFDKGNMAIIGRNGAESCRIRLWSNANISTIEAPMNT